MGSRGVGSRGLGSRRVYNPWMPELPEVECVRRSLEPALLGEQVVSVRVHRAGVVQGVVRGGSSAQTLLAGQQVQRIGRLGKQLAVVGRGPSGRAGCVIVHLGMSGQLRWEGSGQTTRPKHTHVVWQFRQGELRFTDPRRFGGVWAYPSMEAAYEDRWSSLGPDALSITAGRLHASLSGTRRMLKPALLDQRVVAGLGNIYVDELLFGAKLSPMMRADTVGRTQAASLARRMKTLLGKAVLAGARRCGITLIAEGLPGGTSSPTGCTAGRACGASGGGVGLGC